MVFVHFGQRYGLLPETCRTVCIGSVEDLNKPAKEPLEVHTVTVHKIEQAEETPAQVSLPRGRPPVVIKPEQLSFLNMPGLTIRKRAKAMGISPAKVHQLVKVGQV